MDCLFCKIIAKQIPSEIIYEDAKVVAILDINPNTPGHTLVIPKLHSENMDVAEDADLSALTAAVKKLAPAIVAATGADGWCLGANNGNAAGQVVMHTHWHVIPRHSADGLKHWPGHPYADGEMKIIGDKIRGQIK
jgi:histidine triad (HIT) family protein